MGTLENCMLPPARGSAAVTMLPVICKCAAGAELAELSEVVGNWQGSAATAQCVALLCFSFWLIDPVQSKTGCILAFSCFSHGDALGESCDRCFLNVTKCVFFFLHTKCQTVADTNAVQPFSVRR